MAYFYTGPLATLAKQVQASDSAHHLSQNPYGIFPSLIQAWAVSTWHLASPYTRTLGSLQNTHPLHYSLARRVIAFDPIHGCPTVAPSPSDQADIADSILTCNGPVQRCKRTHTSILDTKPLSLNCPRSTNAFTHLHTEHSQQSPPKINIEGYMAWERETKPGVSMNDMASRQYGHN